MKISVNFFLNKERKNKDGKYSLKLMVYYLRKAKPFGTGIYLTEKEFNNLLTRKILRNDLKEAQYYLNKAENIIEEIKHYFSYELFREKFYNQPRIEENVTIGKQYDIFQAFDEYIQELRDNNQIRTADGYLSSKNKLRKYVGKQKKLFFNNITPKFLNEFEKFLITDGNTYSTVGIYTRNIRRIFNYKNIPAELYPFGHGKYTPPSSSNIKKALNLEDIEKLYDYYSDLEKYQKAKDMWFFSYFANGINFKDIALMKKKYIHWDKNEIIYYRSKTSTRIAKKQTIQILLNDDLRSIINKWGSKKGEYVFPVLLPEDNTNERVVLRVNQFIKNTNKYLKKISKDLGLSRSVTTNYARHSFSTVLKRSGVPIEMISEQLGHSTIKTTQIYLDSFENEQKQAAMKHLEAFKRNSNKGKKD